MGWAGDLEPYRASVITQAARQVGHEQLSEFEARLHHGDITDLPGSRLKTRAGLIATRLAPPPDPDDPEQDNTPASVADRGVRVGPGEQAGLTKWDALLPTDSSLSMCAAIDTLAAQYRQDNPQLTVAASRADALVDLVLSDVQVTTTATLIIPTTDAPTPTQPTQPGTPAPPIGCRQPGAADEPGPADTNPVPNRRAPAPATGPATDPREVRRRRHASRSRPACGRWTNRHGERPDPAGRSWPGRPAAEPAAALL